MKCPNCGAAELIADVRDIAYTYKGEATILAQATGDFCPVCGEGVCDGQESRRLSEQMIAGCRKKA